MSSRRRRRRKQRDFCFWKTHPIVSALVQRFRRAEDPHLRTREAFMSHAGPNGLDFPLIGRLSDYFSRFSTVFPSAHTLTLHSKRFSSLISATLKPSTGSSFKLLYSKAKALTADEFMFVLLWIAIDFDCESKILLSVLGKFLCDRLSALFVTVTRGTLLSWHSETLLGRITRWFWDKLERQWSDRSKRQFTECTERARNYDSVQWRRSRGKQWS